jgi:hypothetical protein
MENKLLETLRGYATAAKELGRTTVSESFDHGIPEEAQTALVRMAAAISLDERLEASESFLSEESPEEIAEAYEEAQAEITRVLDSAFLEASRYVASDNELERRVELLSVSTESSGLADDLLKLYKCEGIIRMAYRAAQRFPVYGTPRYMTSRNDEDDEEILANQEQYILDRTGVDVYALMEIRARLITDVQRAMGGEAPQR